MVGVANQLVFATDYYIARQNLFFNLIIESMKLRFDLLRMTL